MYVDVVFSDATPATFETPDIAPRQTPKPTDENKEADNKCANEEDEHPAHNPEPKKSML